MTDDLFIVAIDLGGCTVPALLTYSEDRWSLRADGEPCGTPGPSGATQGGAGVPRSNPGGSPLGKRA